MGKRYMQANHGCEIPSNLMFVDTEAFTLRQYKNGDIDELAFRCFAAIALRREGNKTTREEIYEGESVEEFWGILATRLDKSRPLWVFAHNLHFDMTMLRLWDRLDDGDLRIRINKTGPDKPGDEQRETHVSGFAIDDCPCFLTLTMNGCTVKFVDSMNYFASPLAEVAAWVGMTKAVMPYPEDDTGAWREYCAHDVLILSVAMLRLMGFWQAHDGGVWKMTTGALAMQSYRHTVGGAGSNGSDRMPTIDKDSPHAEYERMAYYGGQTTCYRIGKYEGEFYVVDCNSLYPYVMRENTFPCDRSDYQPGQDIHSLDAASRVWGVTARVRISSRSNLYPTIYNGHTMQGRGVFDTWLTGSDLLRALHYGDVLNSDYCVYYKMDYLFRDWVDMWYRRKLDYDAMGEEGKSGRKFCKNIMNSLYGKFAQKNCRWEFNLNEPPHKRWGVWYEDLDQSLPIKECRGIAGYRQEMARQVEPQYSFPAISAYVTAYGREYMQKIRDVALPCNVYYQATDMFILTRAGYDNLNAAGYISRTELGKFKIEKCVDKIEIVGPNHYKIGHEWVRSGTWGKAYVTAEGKWRVQIWDRIKTTIAHKPDGHIRVKTAELLPESEAYPGNVDADGWVQPPTFAPVIYLGSRPLSDRPAVRLI
jgi:hypothetical protein